MRQLQGEESKENLHHCVISHNPLPEITKEQRKEQNLFQMVVVIIKILHTDMTLFMYPLKNLMYLSILTV